MISNSLSASDDRGIFSEERDTACHGNTESSGFRKKRGS